MKYKHNGQEYELNLIDTPGHVDFHYEVSRSLACCEGAMLLVDAFQGVEAQTVANAYAAMEHDLTIVPVHQQDRSASTPASTKCIEEMEHTLAIDPDEVIGCSGKTGLGIAELLDAVIDRVPPPTGDPDGVAAGDGVRLALRRLPRRGHLRPGHERHGSQRGRRSASCKPARRTKCSSWASSCRDAVGLRRARGRPGRLLDLQHQVARQRPHRRHGHACPATSRRRAAARLPSSRKRMVFCGLYPSDGQDFEELRDALDKLSINDPSFEFEPETSDALASASAAASSACCTWRSSSSGWSRRPTSTWCRPRRTSPTRSSTTTARRSKFTSRKKCPTPGEIEEFRQPIVRVNFVLPTEYIGP